MIKPTVGRIVHYYDTGFPEPKAAIIGRVWSDTCINVCIFDDLSTRFETSVTLRQPEDAIIEGIPRCEWMPYQVKKGTGSESGERAAGTEAV